MMESLWNVPSKLKNKVAGNYAVAFKITRRFCEIIILERSTGNMEIWQLLRNKNRVS